ncbi:regulator of G-protein signaling 6-like [Limulus polyphemus]|uniref:Regulator of G-protein signaling 6-like n=1 Tax=Limulus polyphemus TaxID=6850 RepID=A0ABM1B0W3_LIMPO|nr:regulator of G-protein signaling 6-like [Limulus polyphemus]
MTRIVEFKGMDQINKQDAPREIIFSKIERLIREMQHPESGVPVRSQKLFLTFIPSVFMGFDLVDWLMNRLNIKDLAEAIHLANLICQHGYFFPVNDTKLTLKDDGTLYRFQDPHFWPSYYQPDDIHYAKEPKEALAWLKKVLSQKWEFICKQAEEQVNLMKERKKSEKSILDSQEKAYWRVHRPPPGILSCFEKGPLANKHTEKAKAKQDLKKQVSFLQKYICRPRTKLHQVVESLIHRCELYAEFDPFITDVQPTNPWISDDITFWDLNSDFVETLTEKRLRRWGISLEELLTDPMGELEFEKYLRKEYSHENMCFWKVVQCLKSGSQAAVANRINKIYEKYLAPGAPCEVNLDSMTLDITYKLMKSPSRYTFDAAQEHVFLLMKKDTYRRFLKSDHYRNLLSNTQQIEQKKKFFNFGVSTRKKAAPSAGVGNRRNSGCHRTSSNVDITLNTLQLSGEHPFTGKHSQSTSDLQDMQKISALNRLSSSSESQDRVNNVGRNALLIPRGAHRMGYFSSSLDGTNRNITLTVPQPTQNLVAPWETES